MTNDIAFDIVMNDIAFMNDRSMATSFMCIDSEDDDGPHILLHQDVWSDVWSNMSEALKHSWTCFFLLLLAPTCTASREERACCTASRQERGCCTASRLPSWPRKQRCCPLRPYEGRPTFKRETIYEKQYCQGLFFYTRRLTCKTKLKDSPQMARREHVKPQTAG